MPYMSSLSKKSLSGWQKLQKMQFYHRKLEVISMIIYNEINKEVVDVPCVEEITEAEVINKIGELTEELYSLSSLSYLISEGLF